MKSYLVVYEQEPGGAWGAQSPDVDGVFALGSALSAHLAFLRESGRPVPDPQTDAGRVAD